MSEQFQQKQPFQIGDVVKLNPQWYTAETYTITGIVHTTCGWHLAFNGNPFPDAPAKSFELFMANGKRFPVKIDVNILDVYEFSKVFNSAYEVLEHWDARRERNGLLLDGYMEALRAAVKAVYAAQQERADREAKGQSGS